MMQNGFMPGRGTKDAIFILPQMNKKHLVKHKPLYFAFVDLEKAFDRVSRKVMWWATRKLGIEEWKIRFVQAMNVDAASSVRIKNTFTEKFGVKVGFVCDCDEGIIPRLSTWVPMGITTCR